MCSFATKLTFTKFCALTQRFYLDDWPVDVIQFTTNQVPKHNIDGFIDIFIAVSMVYEPFMVYYICDDKWFVIES